MAKTHNSQKGGGKKTGKILVHKVIYSAVTVNIISSAWTRKMFSLAEFVTSQI
jgi:hypothetical protein